MSDVLTINTEQGIVKEESLMPLPVFGEDFPMLKEVMPEFDTSLLPNKEVSDLVARMKMTMKLYSGVGLSANQCGVKARIFVIGSEHFQMACVNPKIVEFIGQQVKTKEGCLSAPGLFVSVPRYNTIKVEYYTEFGERKELEISGLTAQCFQHELDHLNGVTFTAKAGPVALQLARQKQQKLIKKVKRSTNGIRI